MPIVFYPLFKFIFAGQVKNDGGFYLQKHTWLFHQDLEEWCMLTFQLYISLLERKTISLAIDIKITLPLVIA